MKKKKTHRQQGGEGADARGKTVENTRKMSKLVEKRGSKREEKTVKGIKLGAEALRHAFF